MSVRKRSHTTVSRSSRSSAARSAACSGLEATGLMFQHTSARLRSGSASTCRQIHLADRGRRVGAGELGAREPVEVDPARVAAVEVEEPRAGAADVAGQRRQHRDRAHDVAAARLALQSLAHPEQRRPRAVGARDVLDQARRHARVARSPQAGVQPLEQRLELVVAEHALAARRPRRRGPRAGSRAPARTRAPHRCRAEAGGRCRPRPPVGVRIGSITITSPGASRSQWSCACGALAEGFAPHTTMQAASAAASGSKPSSLDAVDVA